MVYRNVALPSCVRDTDVNERQSEKDKENQRETKTDRDEDAVSLEKMPKILEETRMLSMLSQTSLG